MNKVEIFHKADGYTLGTYEKNTQGVWTRYADGIEIETIAEPDLYNVVFGGHSKKERFFYIIDMKN